MKEIQWIAVSVLAVALFGLGLVLFGSFGLGAVLGVIGFGAGIAIFRSSPKIVVPPGLDPETVTKEVEAAHETIAEIRKLARQITKVSVSDEARHVVDVMERIMKDLHDDPSDIRRARTFLSYHVDATYNVFKRYVELSAQNLRDPELIASLGRTEQSFRAMAVAYEKLLAGLLENDLMDLDAEIKTLESTFISEGVDLSKVK